MDQNVPPHWTMEDRQDADPRGAAVGIWMRQDLKRRYDAALREPLPRDLIELIEQDRSGD